MLLIRVIRYVSLYGREVDTRNIIAARQTDSGFGSTLPASFIVIEIDNLEIGFGFLVGLGIRGSH